MGNVTINMPSALLDRLRQHLFPRGGVCEEAAFLFARNGPVGRADVLDVFESELIAPAGFTSRSRYYLELSDATRAALIKRAHDLSASLIECHSHPGQRQACFSWSDLHGFDEFVPHVMWRLKDRPYAAIVMASDTFDGLVWSTADAGSEAIRAITTERGELLPTGLTSLNWSEIYDRQPV